MEVRLAVNRARSKSQVGGDRCAAVVFKAVAKLVRGIDGFRVK